MKPRTLVLLVAGGWLALAGHPSMAQSESASRNASRNANFVNTGNGVDNPDWMEEQTPSPPEFSVDRLILLEMPAHVSVKVGVDPQTISVGGDGVVRYVIVMRNLTGNTSATFEGIRCASDEFKTYARRGSSGAWSIVTAPSWKALNDNMPSQHAKFFARQGGCQNRLATNPQAIIAALKAANKPGLGASNN